MAQDLRPTQNKAGTSTIDTVGTNSTSSTIATETTVAGGIRKTTMVFNAHPVTITDALTYVGEKIFDFPEGVIAVLASSATLTFTTTSTLATTLNASVVLNWSVGTATAAAATLLTTACNLIADATTSSTVAGPVAATSSATINVANTATSGIGPPAILTSGKGQVLLGQTTAADAYLNLGVPTNTDIDGDATVNVSGTLTFLWCNLHDL